MLNGDKASVYAPFVTNRSKKTRQMELEYMFLETATSPPPAQRTLSPGSMLLPRSVSPTPPLHNPGQETLPRAISMPAVGKSLRRGTSPSDVASRSPSSLDIMKKKVIFVVLIQVFYINFVTILSSWKYVHKSYYLIPLFFSALFLFLFLSLFLSHSLLLFLAANFKC